MRKLFALIVLLFSFNLTAHAQVYIFTGDVKFCTRCATIADDFDNATTFTATLTFDTSQTTADAASVYSDPGVTDDAAYDIGSITYQLGGQSWTHSGTWGGSDNDYVNIHAGITSAEIVSIYGDSDHLLDNGYTVTSTVLGGGIYSNIYHTYAPTFGGADASNLLAFNDFTSTFGKIRTDFGIATLSNITMTAAVPEPSTWLMMLIGFGMVASVHRRQRRINAPKMV